MTDGIRRTNVSVPLETNTSQVENDPKTAVHSTKQPVLGYSNVRDSYEAANSAINQTTTPPVPDAQPKVDAGAADLLNQQLLNARLGTPLFGKQKQIPGINAGALPPPMTPNLKQAIVQVSDEKNGQITEAIDKQNQENARLKADLQNLNQQIGELQQQKEGIRESIQKQKEKLSGLEIGSAKQAELAEKIADIDKQISELKEEIRHLKGKIQELEKKLAETEDPAMKAKIRAQIEQIEDQIKQTDAEIQSLKQQAQALSSGEQTNENTRTPIQTNGK